MFRLAVSVAVPVLVGWAVGAWRRRRDRCRRAGYEAYARAVVDGIAAEVEAEAEIRAWIEAEEDTKG